MKNYSRVITLASELSAAVAERNGKLMQEKFDALDLTCKAEFGSNLKSYDSFLAFSQVMLANARYFAFNNMYEYLHANFDNLKIRYDGMMKCSDFTPEQKEELTSIINAYENLKKATPVEHRNRRVPRCDTRCCLCRLLPANKTGSHMVPNFLAHPTFSWDGKGKRFHEALNHSFLNDIEKFCTFYGSEVPPERFAMGEGKEEVSEEDIEKNINQLEYDNEFCSGCENRFGILETAYSQLYNGQKKNVHPRVTYLFWLSVLWRMSMGSMSIFMDMHDELQLRELLDRNMLDSEKAIADSNIDLGSWKYVIFRAEGLKDGDKSILGSRMEHSPYVVMFNDLVMVFYHDKPSDKELSIGPIVVDRDKLNDWHTYEQTVRVDRRFYWDVRDWMNETSYDYYDPVREKALITIREKERSTGKVIDDKDKEKLIKAARLSSEQKVRRFRLRKFERIFIAWTRKQEAAKDGKGYDPLKDEEVYLTERDFMMYYEDIAVMSRHNPPDVNIEKMPFFQEARKAIPEEEKWNLVDNDDVSDPEYMSAMTDMLSGMKPKEINHLLNGTPEPYINPYKGIGRNDPCPCGSGLKFKKCCGKGV